MSIEARFINSWSCEEITILGGTLTIGKWGFLFAILILGIGFEITVDLPQIKGRCGDDPE